MHNKSNWYLMVLVFAVLSPKIWAQDQNLEKLLEDELSLISHHESAFIISERELLRAYLKELEKSSQRNVKIELARLRFAQIIFSEYNDRWWEQFNLDQRDKKIQDYWKSYRQGEVEAEKIVSTSGDNYCPLLKKVYDQKLIDPPYFQAFQRQAFLRGMKSAYPECFIGDWSKPIKELDKQVDLLQTIIFNIKEKLRLERFLELETENIYQQIKDSQTKAVQSEIQILQKSLQNLLTFNGPELEHLKIKVAALKTQIDCSHLRDRNGGHFQCEMNILGGVDLTLADTYRVIFQGQSTWPFAPKLVLTPLISASTYYLNYIRPNDRVVLNLLSEIEKTLTALEERFNLRVSNAIENYKISFAEREREIKLAQSNLWRSFFPHKQTKELIENFYTLRQQILTFEKWDLLGTADRTLLTRVKSNYQNTLEDALSVSLSYCLPARKIFVSLGDSDQNTVQIPLELPSIPQGLLMGPTDEETVGWRKDLSLHN